MNEQEAEKKTTVQLLRESIDAQAKEVQTAQNRLDAAKKELSRLRKAIKQWEPKE